MNLIEKPIQGEHRIDLLDIYRGFAILGIFVVNIVIMNSTFLNQDEFAKQWTSDIDHLSERVLQLFFYTKFFPIFSLLFGLGISMQALKFFTKNERSSSFLVRRMLILFVIGICHIVFLWSGDVVHIYAIIGLFTILMMKRSNTLILALSAFLILFPFYNQLLEYIFTLANFKPESYLDGFTGASVNEIIRTGAYTEGLKLRVLEYVSNIPMLFSVLVPIATSMFLLGLYLGKNKLYQSLDSVILKTKMPMVLIALITNVYRVLFLFVLVEQEFFSIEFYREILIKVMMLCDVAMGLFYLWAIGWIYFYTNWKRFLLPLRYAGRMALTNYIMQSLIGLIIFSSVGFGYYETFSSSGTLLIACSVFVVQIVLSKVWLTYFQFGPLEWVWRCLTYKELLPITKIYSAIE